MEPMLLRARSGKIAARAIAWGFGGGTMLLGTVSVLAGAVRGGGVAAANVVGGLVGYAVFAMPFFLLSAVVALGKSELWFAPEARAFRLLTFRPWRHGPTIEEAALAEYVG